MFRPHIDIGTRFGKLVVIANADPVRIGKNKTLRQRSIVKCDCGNVRTVLNHNLRSGGTQSCGQCHKLFSSRKTYGDSRGSNKECVGRSEFIKLYNVWRGIKRRCADLENANYGGRGISICEEWGKSWLAFKKWALTNGYRDGLSIDRVNNNGNYEPTNCRWVTRIIQNRNQRHSIYVTAFGKTQHLSEWAEELRVPYRTLYGWVKGGKFIEEMLPCFS